MDASNIARRLWVGSKPPFDRPLPEFDVLVLCARELQPEQIAFKGATYRVPLPDSALSDSELRTAILGGRAVGKALTSGKRVLVTCRAGLNRSAFVAGLGLGMVTQLTGPQIVEIMRKRRAESALHNPHFCEYLGKFCLGRARVR